MIRWVGVRGGEGDVFWPSFSLQSGSEGDNNIRKIQVNMALKLWYLNEGLYGARSCKLSSQEK